MPILYALPFPLSSMSPSLPAAPARFPPPTCPHLLSAATDTGGGNALNVQRTVKDLIAAGAAGCFLEVGGGGRGMGGTMGERGGGGVGGGIKGGM